MDCLSYFSNSDTVQLQDCFIPDVDMIIPETNMLFQAQHQHQQLHHDKVLSPSFFEFNHFYEPFLPSQEIFPPSPKTEVFNESQDLDSFFLAPKIQYPIDSSFTLNSHESLFPSPNSNTFEFQAPDFSPAFKVGWNEKRELSTQSIAARKRRRRITEKTQELGKLIPGSQKHNTAEMFHAAARYVKFLQAKIEILQLTHTKMKIRETLKVDREMQLLLESGNFHHYCQVI